MDPLIEELKGCDGGRILDVACGHGDFLNLLTESFDSFTEAIGIDSASERIEQAREKYPEAHRFEVMDASAMEYLDNHFDTVAIRHSLHHLPNVGLVLDEMKRVLKPGGRFIVCEVTQAPETERRNSHRHAHHWWARVSRSKGETHNETFTTDEVRAAVSPLNLKEMRHLEYLEEITEEEMSKAIAEIIEVNAKFIDELTKSKADIDLISEGKTISAILQREGLTLESVYYIFGRK